MPTNKKIQRIAWITSTLNEAGGGSRLLLEGAKYYKSIGIEVLIITWDFQDEVLFDGRYDRDDIFEIEGSRAGKNSLTTRAFQRLKTISTLRAKLKAFKPDIIFNQSEYDATLLKMALVGTPYKHASFVFGQMYQFHKDLAKYAFPYKKHLEEIRTSTPGYREFVSPTRPPSRWRDIMLAQAIAIPRYFALRASVAIFVFSKQVQWEVAKVYGAKADIQKGAYPRAIIGQSFAYDISGIKKSSDEVILLSLCRLIEKKRVALKIEAFNILRHERGHKNLRLVIGGKGNQTETLKTMVRDLGLENHVTFLGYVPEPDLYPLTAACDLYLSMDVADFDISPYEALAMRRKVIWSSEMDQDEYLAGCGAIFPTEPTPGAVADAVEKALTKDEKSIDWSGLDRYPWETYFQNILEIVEAKI